MWTGSFRRISKGTIMPQILRVKAQACCITKKCWRAFFVCCYWIKTEYASLCRDVTYPHIANIFLRGNPKREKKKKNKPLVWNLVHNPLPHHQAGEFLGRGSRPQVLGGADGRRCGWLVGLVVLSGGRVVKRQLTFGRLVGWLVWSTEIIWSLCWRCWNVLQFLVQLRRGVGSIKASGCSCPKLYSSLPLAGRQSSTLDLKSFLVFNNFEVNKWILSSQFSLCTRRSGFLI